MSWMAIEGQELALISQRVKSTVSLSALSGHVRKPGFYRLGALVRLATLERSRSFVAAGDGPLAARRFYPLDGSVDSIGEANEAARIEIASAEDAADYLRFFCAELRIGDFGFNVVDRLPPGYGTDRHLHIDVTPLEAWPDERAGHFGARGYFELNSNLAIADFTISANGLVAMLADEPLGLIVPHQTN